MAKSIVYMFKIIEVDIDKCPVYSRSPCLMYIFCEILLTAHPVVQSCQEIVICLTFNLLLVPLLFCYLICGTKAYFSSIHPLNLCPMYIKPFIFNWRIHFFKRIGVCTSTKNCLIYLIFIDRVLKQFLKALIHVEHFFAVHICDIYSAACIFKYCNERCIRTCQRVFNNSLRKHTLYHTLGII